MKLVIFFFLFASCAHQGIKEEMKEENISLDAVLNLGRSAYLKGCVDANTTKKSSVFEKCKLMSKEYEKELKEILK